MFRNVLSLSLLVLVLTTTGCGTDEGPQSDQQVVQLEQQKVQLEQHVLQLEQQNAQLEQHIQQLSSEVRLREAELAAAEQSKRIVLPSAILSFVVALLIGVGLGSSARNAARCTQRERDSGVTNA